MIPFSTELQALDYLLYFTSWEILGKLMLHKDLPTKKEALMKTLNSVNIAIKRNTMGDCLFNLLMVY